MVRIFAICLLATAALFAAPVSAASGGTSVTIRITGDLTHLAAPDMQAKARQAAALIAAEPSLKALRLKVEVKGELVVISGRVFNAAERAMAEQVVLRTPGIVAVDNRIVSLEQFMPTTLGATSTTRT